jgi:hypothetical protein
MTMARTKPQDKGRIKEPEEWTTGDEPMTGAQESYLHTLAREAGEPVSDDLTKAEASKKIDDLQKETGRGPATARPRKRTPRRKKT